MRYFQWTFLGILLMITAATQVQATTWDEPWMDAVIREADYFVLADVISVDEHKGAKIHIRQQFGGGNLPEDLEITNFYFLEMTSNSAGHGPEFHLPDSSECYFFLKKNKKGEYCIPTPTTGFAYRDSGDVFATYRHSYHQTKISVDIFEMTMQAIFNKAHRLKFDEAPIRAWIDEQLAKKPAGFEDGEINDFFMQHVALETIFHLRLTGYEKQVLPFFQDSINRHNRISAARAMIANDSEETKELLLEKIGSTEEDDFTKVICIWTLRAFKPKELKNRLKKLAPKASEEYTGFGGSIMDPRVGTHFPSVKQALEELIADL
ncbi:MAG: hypothetical protein KA293_07275 [Bacteroidia bacterium]|nr:hypothetical protein [Bacteroidia bacterium]